MIVSLPMYDRAETAPALDRFWSSVRAGLTERGIDAPERLLRERDLWDHWESPDLLLSQTCGLPYRSRLHGKVRIVGTLDHGLDGCPPGHYNSVIVVRAEDPDVAPADWRAKRMAYNEGRSQSGWAAMYNHAAALGTGFLSAEETGSHLAAARSVAEGRADIACIDAQTWRMITAWEPWAGSLREIDRTEPTPGLPLITAADTPPETVEALRASVGAAVDMMDDDDRSRLNMRGLVHIPSADYLAVTTPAA